MQRLGTVQQKIPCVFNTEVQDLPSGKREGQLFTVFATEHLNPSALDSNIFSASATEKLDGTCCYVSTYKGEHYLWARLDRKPNKQADKRFRKFQSSKNKCTDFTWNLQEDFKSVPGNWIPAQRVRQLDGNPLPDEHGHIPGWVPVEKTNKQYCWHSSVVDYETGLALVLRPLRGDENMLEITCVPLLELQQQTLELIGTNINGNPYGLGNKKWPIHLLVPHGILHIRDPPSLNYKELFTWLSECDQGKVEGIVWHCNDGALFKLHRHHVNLKWPSGKTFLNTRPVVIHVDCHRDHLENSHQFSVFSNLNGQHFSCVEEIKFV